MVIRVNKGVQVDENVKNRRLETATHYKRMLQERINRLRKVKPTSVKEEVMLSNAIGYLSNVALTAIRDSDMEERVKQLELKLFGKAK